MITDLPPSSSLGSKLCQIFSYPWLAIQGSTDDATDPQWETVGSTPEGHGKFPLKQRSQWQTWLDPARLAGIRFDHTTRYAVIDVDKRSIYHTEEGLKAIEEALETIGLVRVIRVRSSWSGGLHLYVPLPEAVNTFDFAAALKYCFEAQELYIGPGDLETFPNCKSYGRPWLKEFTVYNAHRLPLQPGSGSVLLNHSYQPIGSSLELFFSHWDFAEGQQDMELLAEAISTGHNLARKRRRIKKHPAATWREDLELELSEGWTGRGQTNTLIGRIACYGRVFEGIDSREELASYIINLATTRPGYQEHCHHRHEIKRKAMAWARAAMAYYWPMGTEAKRTQSTYDHNQAISDDARARIQSAVVQLTTLGQLPKMIGERARAICELAKTSAQTLYKNLSLWRSDQWCVTALAEGDTAHLLAPPDNPGDRFKRLISALLHTPPSLMKCTPPESASKKNLYSGIGVSKGEEKSFPQANGGV